MTNNYNKRFVSGERVVCECALTLPSNNPFYHINNHRTGFVVINVRGCNLYLPDQYNLANIGEVFPDRKPAMIKNFRLFAEDRSQTTLGDVQARFLHFREGTLLSGMVLRFSNLSEEQLDTLNQLNRLFPLVDRNEESSIPMDALNSM